MSKYGITIQPGVVIMADHDTLFSCADYFKDKPEFKTYATRDEADAAFHYAAAELSGHIRYGFRYDGDDTVFVVASLLPVDGFTYPDEEMNAFKRVRTLALVERGTNHCKNQIAAEM